MPTCLIFVYGLLQPGFHPPHSVRRAWRDQIRGKLFDLGPYPGGIDFESAPTSFEGWVLEIDEAELARLDEFEGVTGEGQFRRLNVRTLGGRDAWAYEYQGPIPPGGEHLSRWPRADRPARGRPPAEDTSA